MSGPEVVVVPDQATGAARAASIIADALSRAVARRGRADWATTGGTTPIGIYQAMLTPDLRARIPWRDVHTWWGDDRFVPGDHPLSNVRPFDDILLEAGGWESVHSDDHRDRVRITVANVHPFQTGEAIGQGRSAAACAAELVEELRAAGLPEIDGWPVFDLILLGVGSDGHILSVFPGSGAFDSKRWALRDPGADPYRAACGARDAQPGRGHGGRARAGGRLRRRQGRHRRPHLRARCRAVGAPRAARAARRRDLAPRRGGRGATGAVTPSESDRLVIRRAAVDDAPDIGEVWLASWRATFDFPPSHPDDDVRRWLATELVPKHETWVAADPREDGRVVALMALSDTKVEQLYVAPEWIGLGLGRRLIALAKARRPEGLDLYCFQVNAFARRFYESHGFVPIAFGDGSGNEERQPDVLYRWRPEGGVVAAEPPA